VEVEQNAANVSAKTQLGFWIYLMTDIVLFATLFATFAVLRESTFGGPGGKELFDMSFVLTETLILLISSFTCGLAVIAMHRGKKEQVIMWFTATFLLGVAFLALEVTEFSTLIHEGNSWQRSGFLSSFFALVGTHGLHILVGLLWMLVMGVQVVRKGITHHTSRRLVLLGMFWHFLDVVWIFIFTIVYLMGVL
jgi:cytochrome o ubiquinol oxidase subunit 3